MLQKLKVKNVVLITEAEIEFSQGLNVLSGETGAGKSIVVDCLMLLFGARYDKSLLRFGTSEGYVEGVFLLNEKNFVILDAMGIEYEEIVIIKRRFTAEGKSEIKINGQTVTVGMLRKLMESLIDIYGQHDFQQLSSTAEQLAILDYYDRHKQREILAKLSEIYEKYKNCLVIINDLGDVEQRGREIDYLKYQIWEIENSGIYKGEEDEIVEKRRRALNIEKIISALSDTEQKIRDAGVGRIANTLSKIEVYDKDFGDFSKRLNSVAIELDDLSDLIQGKLDELTGFNVDIDKLEDRLAFLRTFNKKYGDYEKMMQFFANATNRLAKLENADRNYDELIAEKSEYIKELYVLSVKLSESRKSAALEFCAKVEDELCQLGMGASRLTIVFNDLPALENSERNLSKNGFDQIEFYFSANVGQPPTPLAKTISGGEMSRFMLALKTITGNSDKIPTLIFDEIDAGISGRMGQEVAKKLAKISMTSQILCVTHLPQLAAMADNHLCVSKKINHNEAIASVEILNGEEIVREISRLSGGVGISETSEQSAAEIKAWSNRFKQSLVAK